ncbi:MAG: NAD(P)H-hydrate dehydratase [Clostridium sp.]|nr:NAD(P)H-hydrate dehydratase [Clostridium sp.]
MNVARADTMRSIDDYCINELKIPEIVLMENAALKVLKNIDTYNNESFVIVCGFGNNGGDGFALSRQLIAINKKVDIFLIGSCDKLSSSCRVNYDILRNMGVAINEISKFDYFLDCLKSSDVTIDALFGTGLKRDICGTFKKVVDAINDNSKYVVSIDVPSGLHSDTGIVMGSAVRADSTVTFELLKRGFLGDGASDFTGKVFTENIGVPDFVLDKFKTGETVLSSHDIKKYIKPRDKYAHKGDFGRVVLFAGSSEYTGASYISTEASVKTGSGLVTLCCPQDIVPALRIKLTEAMIASFDEEERCQKLMLKADALAFGPGMGNTEITFNMLKRVINSAKCPIVIDADGLNALSCNLGLLKSIKIKAILTPHLGEMSRLTGFDIDYIKHNRIDVAEKFAKDYGVILLLKGHNTVITDGKTTYINPTGNSAMASGGMGDCLTGIIASLVSQGLSPLMAAAVGAYIHGYTGDLLSKSAYCVSAGDLLSKLPYSIKKFMED